MKPGDWMRSEEKPSVYLPAVPGFAVVIPLYGETEIEGIGYSPVVAWQITPVVDHYQDDRTAEGHPLVAPVTVDHAKSYGEITIIREPGGVFRMYDGAFDDARAVLDYLKDLDATDAEARKARRAKLDALQNNVGTDTSNASSNAAEAEPRK